MDKLRTHGKLKWKKSVSGMWRKGLATWEEYSCLSQAGLVEHKQWLQEQAPRTATMISRWKSLGLFFLRSLFPQPLQVPLDGSEPLWCVSYCWFSVICSLGKDTLCPIFWIVNGNVKQDHTPR